MFLKSKGFLINYFSGTGGVKKIVDEFKNQLSARDVICKAEEISYKSLLPLEKIEQPAFENQYFILIYPVHACDAPEIVYSWVEKQSGKGQKTIVISVSGGGEVWPNIGTRSGIIESLGKKGFLTVYEKMLIMPSNWLISPNEHGAMHLIQAIPGKVGKILDDLAENKSRLISEKRGWFQKWISALEKKHAHDFSKSISVGENCNGCGWCSHHCPLGNIAIEKKRPVFGKKCIMCFRCIYGCPGKALVSNNFQVLKQGYDLNQLEKRMRNVPLKPVSDCFKGFIWSGALKYLEEDN